MTLAEQAEPGWLRRSDAQQPFVLSICASGDLDKALAKLPAELEGLKIGAETRIASACNMTVDCSPARAWSLLQRLRSRLTEADVYIQPEAERGKRLLICDMDMTIIDAETLDEVAATLGMGEAIAGITARAMHGEIDFNAALRERIAMLAGQPEQVFHDVAQQVRLNPGASELLAGARAAGGRAGRGAARIRRSPLQPPGTGSENADGPGARTDYQRRSQVPGVAAQRADTWHKIEGLLCDRRWRQRLADVDRRGTRHRLPCQTDFTRGHQLSYRCHRPRQRAPLHGPGACGLDWLIRSKARIKRRCG